MVRKTLWGEREKRDLAGYHPRLKTQLGQAGARLAVAAWDDEGGTTRVNMTRTKQRQAMGLLWIW